MPERPRFSRFRRLPGLYRIADDKPPDLDAIPQLLAIYLPAGLLDRAEAIAVGSGFPNVQDYCANLLRSAISQEENRQQSHAIESRRETMESLDAIANDPDYLAELTVETRTRTRGDLPLAGGPTARESLDSATPRSSPEAVVRHHADAAGDDNPAAFLVKLRRGEPIDPATRDDLLAALVALEHRFATEISLDRALVYSLHRIAFEGQILISEGSSPASNDPASVDALLRVQEGVDRVLSGLDIRYAFDPQRGA